MPILNKAARKSSPARTLVLGFLIIIIVGALLLCLPISSKSGSFTPVFDSLFMSVSSTCVIGLVLVDTFSYWSFFGQLVIALLVQVGGIGFVTIITFFNVAAGKKLGYRTLASAADGLTENNFVGGRAIFISIMKYSLIIELAGAILLAFVFVPRYGAYGIWVSIFMSINSFCNAGFDLMGIEQAGAGLTLYQNDPLVLLTVAVLTILGGLGFIVWENFINIRKVKKLSLHTRAVLIMGAILTVGGTVFYLIAEWSNPDTMGGMSFGEKLLNAFFTSVTTRSSGYNSISAESFTEFGQLGTMLLMFVGAAPASTGGGIKSTTLLVLVMTVVSYIRNKNDVEIFHHKIDKMTVYRTLVVSVLSMAIVATCFTGLYCTMPRVDGQPTSGALQCLFESVSVYGTTGYTAGATAAASTAGRCLLMLTMFAGRVGPVSIIMSLALNNKKRKNIVVPDGQILIG